MDELDVTHHDSMQVIAWIREQVRQARQEVAAWELGEWSSNR